MLLTVSGNAGAIGPDCACSADIPTRKIAGAERPPLRLG
jgi:hypothetical protein